MRKLMVLALGLGLVSLPGTFTLPAKAQSIQPPHTQGAGNPYSHLKRKKRTTAAQAQSDGGGPRAVKRKKAKR